MMPGVGVRQRTSPGGAGPVPVEAQLVAFAAELAQLQTRVG